MIWTLRGRCGTFLSLSIEITERINKACQIVRKLRKMVLQQKRYLSVDKSKGLQTDSSQLTVPSKIPLLNNAYHLARHHY